MRTTTIFGLVSNRSTPLSIWRLTSPWASLKDGYPGPQGPYYTSVGARNTKGRELIDEHLHLCLEAGLNAEGINAEVMMGQWEVSNLRQGGEKRWRPNLACPLPPRAYGGKLRHRHRPSSQTHQGRLERIGDARLLQWSHARRRRRGAFHKNLRGVR